MKEYVHLWYHHASCITPCPIFLFLFFLGVNWSSRVCHEKNLDMDSKKFWLYSNNLSKLSYGVNKLFLFYSILNIENKGQE